MNKEDRAQSNPLESRIASLEQRGRVLTACLLGWAAILTLSAFAPRDDDVVRGRKIELVDSEGRVRAELAIDEDGSAGLFVRDEETRLRASVTHDDEQSALYLWDAEGTIRVGAAQFAHGGGGYALHGRKSKGAAVLYLEKEGSLTFYDGDGGVIDRVPD